ncbi:MAG: heme-binding domain-containing protein [Myxococcota bacterium]|jgi:hypothetical protein|nr:heme-binding domain-containing protein [Myxococcota bacterium]
MTLRNKILAGIGCIVLAIQLVPVDRENPPVEAEITAPEDVRAVLQRACYDCHSNESVWPWYGYIAPVSWLVEYDIEEAREHMNFSTWNRYDAEDQIDMVEEIWEEVEEGEMPPFFYTPLHPEARLTPREHALIQVWAHELP